MVNTVRTVEELGKKQYAEYQKSVLVDHTKSIHVPIKKNSLRSFKCPASKPKSKQADKIATLKTDVSMFSRLYIVAQHRECDMTAFFSHENHPFPPSLSDNGKLRQGNKSDQLRWLEKATDIDRDDFIEASDLTTLYQIEDYFLVLEPDTITSPEKECATDVPSYQAATPCRSSWAKENEQHGGLGCHILKSHRPSTSSPPIPSP